MTATVELLTLNPAQLDALREVANIGAGHAATALSTMIDTTVMISVPRITVQKLTSVSPMVSAGEEPVAAVLLHMLGDATGHTLLVFPRDVALRMTELMLRRDKGSSTTIGMLEQSAINEVGNILSSAYMNALADLMGMILLPSPPTFSVDSSATVLSNAHTGDVKPENVVLVETELLHTESNEQLRGFFLLLPDPAALNAILRAMKLE